jgi:hypothetical protein
MKGDNKNKMKSLLVVIAMLTSAMFAFVAFIAPSVNATANSYLPAAFSITNPTVNGTAVTGQVNVTWGVARISGASTNIKTSYNITIVNHLNNAGYAMSSWIKSPRNGNATWYLWNTTSWPDGIYDINVTAINVTGGAATRYWRNATSFVRVVVRNTMHGTPGVSQWQGGNNAIAGDRGAKILSAATPTSSFYYGHTADVTVLSALNWSGTYYLYKPLYNGSESSQSAYLLNWTRVDALNTIVSGSDWTFSSITFDRAGIWIIDNTDGARSDADMRNISQFNSTVPAWFWVNTSRNLTIDLGTDTTFLYNNSAAALTYTLKEEGGTAVTDTYAVGDIRRQTNASSIRGSNVLLGTGGQNLNLPWYKNNSYDVGNTAEAREGFWTAGNYTAHGYIDVDYYGTDPTNGRTTYRLGTNGNQYAMNTQTHGWVHYNNTFGSNQWRNGSAPFLSGATRYNWTFCGPWDPPEKNATIRIITVTTNTPTTSIPTANQTMYFDFPGEVNISIREANGAKFSTLNSLIQGLNVSIWNEQGTNVTGQFLVLNVNGQRQGRDQTRAQYAGTGKGLIDLLNVSMGYIRINHSSWGNNVLNAPFGLNGTWTIKIYQDRNRDRKQQGSNKQWTEEWNTSAVTFTVASSTGRLVFTMIDDDGNVTGGTNSDGVIRRVPDNTRYGVLTYNVPVRIQFSVQNSGHRYLGALSQSDAEKNITLSGDALFLDGGSVRLDNYPSSMFSYSSGTWTINMIPVMDLNGGKITIAVDWGTYGSYTETITIGGASLNGTIVEVSPTSFTYNKNTTVTVTVKDPSGNALTGGRISLYWLKDNGGLGGRLNTTITPDAQFGNTYSFKINKTQMDTWQRNSTNGWSSVAAPRNITAYANVSNVGCGYARIKMNAVEDLKVTVYPSEVMAGQGQAMFRFNVSTIDSTGNKTGRPQNTNLKVRLYNSTGHDVTGKIGSFTGTELDGTAYNYNLTNDYLREPGVYTVHAYNNSHQSEGSYNATLTVTPVDVVCNLGEIVWGVDKNISAKFTVTYKGQPINNTGFTDYFRIDNISKQGSGTTQYNKTWTNTTFRWGLGAAGSDVNTNTSLEVWKSSGGFVNGVVTICDITANTLDERLDSPVGLVQPSERLIHFFYKPGATSSVYANCSGTVKVKIPSVAVSPASLPYNKPAELELTVTGRGIPLEDVRVNITVPGLTALSGSDTNSEGIVVFAFTPPATGNIVIKIENRTSATKVPVTAWSLYLDVPSQTNEGESFTITVKNGTSAGAAVAGATVTFNRNTYTTGTDGTVTIPDEDVPQVTANREYPIVATKTGHAEASSTIIVLNVPILSVIAPSTVTADSTFDVVVADDAGNPIIGATITLDGAIYTSGANGIAKVTAPAAGTYTITASKTGFVTSEPVTITVKPGGIPGFELVTLIAAIGVALILLRRRRN